MHAFNHATDCISCYLCVLQQLSKTAITFRFLIYSLNFLYKKSRHTLQSLVLYLDAEVFQSKHSHIQQ